MKISTLAGGHIWRTSFSAVAAPAIDLNAQTMDCSIWLAFIRLVTKPRLSEQSAVCTRTQTYILSNRRNTFLTTTFAWRRSAGTMSIIKQLAPEVVYTHPVTLSHSCIFIHSLSHSLTQTLTHSLRHSPTPFLFPELRCLIVLTCCVSLIVVKSAMLTRTTAMQCLSHTLRSTTTTCMTCWRNLFTIEDDCTQSESLVTI